MVDTALHMDMDRIKAAGYNIRSQSESTEHEISNH